LIAQHLRDALHILLEGDPFVPAGILPTKQQAFRSPQGVIWNQLYGAAAWAGLKYPGNSVDMFFVVVDPFDDDAAKENFSVSLADPRKVTKDFPVGNTGVRDMAFFVCVFIIEEDDIGRCGKRQCIVLRVNLNR
jgi:hypothetical protein